MVGVIIQARMGSSRLPQKSLMEIDGRPLIFYSVKRAELAKYVEKVIVATTDNEIDNEIDSWCIEQGIDCFRGNEENVLDRYYKAAKEYNFDIVVRITGDNPFVDPEIIDYMILNLKTYKKDYVTMRDCTSTWPYGLDVEVLTIEALEKAWKLASSKYHTEHVTTYIKDNKQEFDIMEVVCDSNLGNIRLSVDYQNDYDNAKFLITKILETKTIDFSWRDVVELYESNWHCLKL